VDPFQLRLPFLARPQIGGAVDRDGTKLRSEALGIGNVKRHLQPTGRKQQQTAGNQTEGKQPPKASPETPPHQEQLNQRTKKYLSKIMGYPFWKCNRTCGLRSKARNRSMPNLPCLPTMRRTRPHCRPLYPGPKFWVRRLSISAFIHRLFLSIRASPKG
jgi:hypothetical protein